MKFTYKWLKQYVDFEWSPQELAEKLTFAGIEVEDVVSLGGNIPEAVVVAQILSSEKHPNADKLSVCRVNDGNGERQIVCGAKNYKVGDRVPLALPGATMGAGFTIKVSKLRGVESQGMMCSAEELGLPKGEDGSAHFTGGCAGGEKIRRVFRSWRYGIRHRGHAEPAGLAQRHRDCARGFGAHGQSAQGFPRLPLRNRMSPVEKLTSVTVEAPDLCPRYTARVIRA